MVWGGKGRSGIGDVSIQGTWEDWDGLSPNGREYKNAITGETRNLSGADYWFARKADYPKQEPETWVNGKANIAAFAEPEQKPKVKKKKSVADSIDLAQRHFDRIEQLSIDLDEEYFAGEIDDERYELLRYKLDKRLIKAWKRLEKDSLPAWHAEDIRWENAQKSRVANKRTSIECVITNTVFDSLSEDNVFRKLFITYRGIKEKFIKYVYK